MLHCNGMMNRYRSQRFKRGNLLLMKWILITITIIALVILVLSASAVFYNGVIKEQAFGDIETRRQCLIENIVLPDSITQEDLKKLVLTVNALGENQETLAGDTRQETNNIINKVNGWIGFWIALLTIFCGIVPMVIQHVQRQQTKREIDDLLDEVTNHVTTLQLQLAIATVNINDECQLVKDSSARNNFISLQLSEANRCLNELISNLEEHEGNLTRTEELQICQILVQYYQLLRVLKLIAGDRVREYDRLQGNIRNLVKETIDPTSLGHHKIWPMLLYIQPHLLHIPLPSIEY